jgi:hypothetical protein
MEESRVFIDFLQGYASILGVVLWPIVVLIIFFTVVFYIERTIKAFDRKKSPQLTWKQLDRIAQKLEDHRSSNLINADASTKRQYLVKQEINLLHNGLEKRDEKQIMRALLSLSMLAQHSDRSLTALNIPEDTKHDSYSTEIILPDEKEEREYSKK